MQLPLFLLLLLLLLLLLSPLLLSLPLLLPKYFCPARLVPSVELHGETCYSAAETGMREANGARAGICGRAEDGSCLFSEIVQLCEISPSLLAPNLLFFFFFFFLGNGEVPTRLGVSPFEQPSLPLFLVNQTMLFRVLFLHATATPHRCIIAAYRHIAELQHIRRVIPLVTDRALRMLLMH